MAKIDVTIMKSFPIYEHKFQVDCESIPGTITTEEITIEEMGRMMKRG